MQGRGETHCSEWRGVGKLTHNAFLVPSSRSEFILCYEGSEISQGGEEGGPLIAYSSMTSGVSDQNQNYDFFFFFLFASPYDASRAADRLASGFFLAPLNCLCSRFLTASSFISLNVSLFPDLFLLLSFFFPNPSLNFWCLISCLFSAFRCSETFLLSEVIPLSSLVSVEWFFNPVVLLFGSGALSILSRPFSRGFCFCGKLLSENLFLLVFSSLVL